jgi:hypothetical protein
MTVVVEGHMRIQFFKADATGKLTRSGTPVDLTAGQTCLIEALRIHDAKYITACKLVYVHNSAYGCYNWASKRGDPRLGTLKRPLTSYGEFPADLPITLILGVAKKAGELFFSR